MFICGNDERAKKLVTEILGAFGWETVDIEGDRWVTPLGATRNVVDNVPFQNWHSQPRVQSTAEMKLLLPASLALAAEYAVFNRLSEIRKYVLTNAGLRDYKKWGLKLDIFMPSALI
jgi:hypothetical protein